MEQDFEELKSKMEEKVKESFELCAFFHHNLNNFAYRYFENPQKSKTVSDMEFVVEANDTKLKNYIKSGNEKIKAGSMNLAKSVPFKEGPCLKLSLKILVKSFDPSRGGEVLVSSRIHWGFPKFEENKNEFFEKSVSLKFDDVLYLRNKLAKTLEEACETFL